MRIPTRWIVLLAAAAAVLGGASTARAAVDYADAGAYSATTTALDAGVGGAIGGNLVVPDAPGAFPLIVASHGWSAGAAQQVGWAQHFASWGFVVVVPAFPNPLAPDAHVDQGIITQLVALYSDPATDSPAKGKVDGAHIGLEGHAGGLATSLAALALRPGATVLFDPVDANDAGKGAYAALCSPLAALFAGASGCNNQAEWSTFAAQTTAPAVTFHVVGSTHCDGENADRGAACGLVCGGAADPARQAVYARYATAFFLAHLKGDTGAGALLASAALSSDPAISGVVTSPGSCAPDAGAPPTEASDAGGGPPGSSQDGGAGAPSAPPLESDAGSGGAAGGAPAGGAGGGAGAPSAGGCGCGLATGAESGPLAVLFFAGVALARRRRQARG